MRTILAAFPAMAWVLVLSACSGGDAKPSGDDTGSPADTDSGEPPDTASEGTDEDGDGWTVEEGDCDDGSIYVNPAWDEDTGDGLDNDCDGRTDEVWTGFTVLWLDSAEGGGELITVDTLGELADARTLDPSCYAIGLDRAPDGAVVVNNGGSALSVVGDDGVCTDLADYSESDYGLAAVGALPDGTFLALSPDALTAVTAAGEATVLASWVADAAEEGFERYATILAVNAGTGEVGIADDYGGFATWDATDGLQTRVAADLEAPVVYLSALAARDGGGWVALGADATSGALGIYELVEEGGSAAWELRVAWEDTQIFPSGLTTEGGTQDVYAIASEGHRGYIWRVRHETGEQAILYKSEEAMYWYFMGILTDYD